MRRIALGPPLRTRAIRRTAGGVESVHRVKARPKAAGSKRPVNTMIRLTDSVLSATQRRDTTP